VALKGSLAEFAVPEVLQLLALQQKSGILVLTHEDGRSHVLFFERGRVLAAADRRRETRHPFLHHLLHNLAVNREQVETVEDISKTTGQDIFSVLLTTGLMGRDRLGEEMHRYCQRIVDDVIGWHSGVYEFSGDERSLPQQGLTVKLNPEELVLESMRRNDELSTLKDSLIASDMVLARAPNPPSTPLPRECMVVLSTIDGRRTVEEICRRSPMGEYLTYDAIAELLGRQQAIIMDPNQAARLAQAEKSRVRLTPLAWALLLIPAVASVLLGTVTGPLLASTAKLTWLPQVTTQHRAEEREHLRGECLRLARSLTSTPRPEPTPVAPDRAQTR